MLMDPTYANYEGQLAFAVPGITIVRLPLMDRCQLDVLGR